MSGLRVTWEQSEGRVVTDTLGEVYKETGKTKMRGIVDGYVVRDGIACAIVLTNDKKFCDIPIHHLTHERIV